MSGTAGPYVIPPHRTYADGYDDTPERVADLMRAHKLSRAEATKLVARADGEIGNNNAALSQRVATSAPAGTTPPPNGQTPGMAALQAQSPAPRQITYDYKRPPPDVTGGVVPWLNFDHSTIPTTATSDSAASHQDALLNKSLPHYDPELTPEEQKAATDKYDKDHAAWQKKKDKATKDNKPFADVEPTLVQERVLKQGDPSEILRPVQEVKYAVNNFNPDQKAELAKRLQQVGQLDDVFNMGQLQQAWDDLVTLAVREHAANPNNMLTPMDMIDLYYGHGGTTGIGSKGMPGTHPTQVIDKTRNISSNGEARGMLQKMMATQLGRRPTGREVDDFQAALNSAQQKNPQVTTTDRSYNASGTNTGNSSTTTGGVDTTDFTDAYVTNKDPDSEFGKYQMATNYYNAFLNAIQGPEQQVH